MFKAFLLYLCCCVLLVFSACSVPPENTDTLNNMLKQAQFSFSQKKYAHTIELCDQILNKDFKNTQAYELKAQSYEYRHNFKKALEIWHQRVFAMTPSEEQKKKIEKKVLYLKKIIKLQKELPKAVNKGSLEELRAFYREYKGTHVAPLVLVAFGEYFSRHNEMRMAEEYYERILIDYPDAPETKIADEFLEKYKRENEESTEKKKNK